MIMPFIDLKAQYRHIQSQVDERIRAVLEHAHFIMGPEVSELEQRLAKRLGVQHGIGVSSGTDALLIALMAWGVGPGDEVITPAFSFVAGAEVVMLLGAEPVFVDVDPATYLLDVDAVKASITPKTRAILAVDLFGQCADYDALADIASDTEILIIEDAAQSLGALYKKRPAGSLATIACTSFYPSKPLGCYGEGGACFTNDERLASLMRQIINHGGIHTYRHECIGLNARLDTLQAAILLAKCDVFDEEIKQRQAVAARYDQLLVEADREIQPPVVCPENSSVYAQYTIRLEQRDRVRKHLTECGIPTAIHYPCPIHHHPAYAQIKPHCSLTESEKASQQVLSLPMHPYLQDKEIEQVVEQLVRCIEKVAS